MNSPRTLSLYFILLLIGILPIAISAERIPQEKNSSHTALNNIKKKVFSYASVQDKPERIPAGRRDRYPQIIIKKDRLFFNSKELRLGKSIESWKKIIAGNPRCFQDEPKFCVWDDAGLEIKTRGDKEHSVTSFTIYFNFFDAGQGGNKYGVSTHPTPAEIHDWLPREVFNGYFELDGFGIDSATQFRDIMNYSAERNLHCGTFDCSNPSGPFSEEANIYISLDSRGNIGRLKEFSITKDL